MRELNPTKKIIFDNFFEVREKLFYTKLFSIENQQNEWIKNLPKNLDYYNQYASINLDFGRQTGSTYFQKSVINDVVRKLSKDYKMLFIFHNNSMIDLFREGLINKNPENIDLIIFNKLNSFRFKDNSSKYRGLKFYIDYDIVFLDCHKYYKRKQFKQICNDIVNMKPKLIVYSWGF